MIPKQNHINGKEFFDKKYYPVLSAIDEQDTARLNLLLNGSNINTIGNKNLTFIVYSFLMDKKKSFAWLMEHGADVNIPFEKDENKFTYMINIATKAENSYYFMLLLKAADLNVQDERGYPPTHNAIFISNMERLYLLLNNGANINITDKDQETPLFFLCLLTNYKDAYHLLMKGADPKIPDNRGNSIAYLIQLNILPTNSEAYLWQQKIKTELINQGIVFPVKKPN